MFDVNALNSACLGAFSETVAYTPKAGVAFSLRVIDVNPKNMEGLQIPQAVVKWAKEVDFPVFPKSGDSVSVSSVSYDVHQVQVDVGGGIFLVLSKS
jgi:hypothetical protein